MQGAQRVAAAGPIDFLNVAYGADLINCGALVEGLQAWARVGEWGEKEIGLIARAVYSGPRNSDTEPESCKV